MSFRRSSLWALAGLAARLACAAQVPAETELHLRLVDPILSATGKAGQVVQAVVIAPVIVGEKIAIPQGAKVAMTLSEVRPAGDKDRALVGMSSFLISFAGFQAKLAAHLSEIDNARETLDSEHRIYGIAGDETLTSQIDKGIGKISEKYGGFGAILEAAKSAIVKKVDPEIDYPAGVEFSVALDKALVVPDAKLSNGPELSFRDADRLADLAAREPFRAYALRPPLPSDLTNLMFIGTEAQLSSAFAEAGWATAAALNANSKLETARAVIEERGYKEGPVSVLTLAGQPPAFVFQKGNNTFAARHHLRIWRRPDTFEGLPVWVCSATHDTGIAYSEADRTFIHKIDSHIDHERAKVVNDLLFTGKVKALALVDRPNVPLDAQNATGDQLITDGAMAVLMLGE